MSSIEAKLKRTPQGPGVYLLKDAADAILYVGKAKKLRNRLRSHFKAGRDEERRHRLMMQKVTDFEYIVTESEVEALILEANVIKEHRPRYNVNLKDDKSFPYIRVTAEPYARVFVTRKIVRDGSRYFGPYTDVGALRRLMAAIRRIFPVRTCGLSINAQSIQQKKHRVCLNYHIGRCLGPCQGLISQDKYQEIIEQVVAFIRGDSRRLEADLRARMTRLAAQQRFEEAAKIRDELESIETFHSRQKMEEEADVHRDLVTVAVDGRDSCGMVMQVRYGRVVNRQHFYMNSAEAVEDKEVLITFLKQYYHEVDAVPREVLISPALADVDDIVDWLTRKRGANVQLHYPQRGKKARLMSLCQSNARLMLEELKHQKEKRGERMPASVLALEEALRLGKTPRRIECFDISNTQGTDSVASLVVFENGRPKKSAYRKFKIKTVKGADDFASMAEVVERRYTRLINEEAPLPDLLMVDGGKGQLSSAVSVLERLGIDGQLPVIGLAKRLEEVFIPGVGDPQMIPKTSPGLRLLQQIRDEAHRFAITFHRQRRQKRIIQSELDAIPGIGPRRRTALLRAFGSLEGLRQASSEEIAAVDGMTSKIAQTLFDYLHPTQS